MWNDPKFKSFMLKNDFFNDWGPSYLKDYGWYFECLKDSTPTKEHASWEKFKVGYLDHFTTFEVNDIFMQRKTTRSAKKRKGKFVELATFGSLGDHIVTKKRWCSSNLNDDDESHEIMPPPHNTKRHLQLNGSEDFVEVFGVHV